MKKIFSLILTIAAAIVFTATLPAYRASAATVLPAATSTPKEHCTFLGIEGKYIVQIQEALDRINAIRLEACKEGVINPSSGKPLTESDYVPIQWNADLEYIARIRAAEASLTMAHERTNGESIWALEGPNGITSRGEVIAWNWSETMVDGINQWYGEKYDWVNNTPGAVTGHYTQMIDPEHLYVGLGTFCSNSVKYYNTTVGEFHDEFRNGANIDSSHGKATGNIIQTLEVMKDYILYDISGEDALSVTPSVSFIDHWGNNVLTTGLVLTGDSAKAVKWSSSNDDIITVDSNGIITVKKCGKATITATTPDSRTLTKEVSYEHSYKTTSTVAATCKADGKTEKTCTICGDTQTEVIPKTNEHSYKTETTAATCKDEGKTVKTCTVCGDTQTEVIPKTNEHSYKTTSTTAATCKDEGKTVKTCTVCGKTETQTIPKTDKHTFGKWETTVKPTAESDGEEARKCSVCGKEEKRALEYEPPAVTIEGESSDTSDTSSGDSSSDTSSDDNSSVTSEDGNSSDTSADEGSSVTSEDDNSSDTQTDEDSSDTVSGGSVNNSAGDPAQSEAVSEVSNAAEASESSDNGSFLKDYLVFIIIAAVLLVALIVLVIIFIKRKGK